MKKWKRWLSVVLCAVLLLGVVQLLSAAKAGDQTVTATLPFYTMSDLHIFPDCAQGSRTQTWLDVCRLDGKMFNESETIIRTALKTAAVRAKKTGAKYLLLPGDLTKDSELISHQVLAGMLEDFEKESGMEVFVINGNHDVNTTQAVTFEHDKKEPTPAITYEQFFDVYKNLGYDHAVAPKNWKGPAYRFAPKKEHVVGGLSYVADLDDAFRLIVVDSCKYSFDEPQPEETTGAIGPELMQWIRDWADQSKKDGRTPFLMIHHSLAAHMEVEPSITYAFVLDDYMDAAETLASMGIHYAFTGHLHINDTACVINDDGEALYDYQSDSLTGFPNTYRENKLVNYKNGKTILESNAVDFDAVEKMKFDGVTYDNHTYKYHSFDLCFGGGLSKNGRADTTSFLMGIVMHYLGDMLAEIAATDGGLIAYLQTKFQLDLRGILEGFLKPYIGDGFKIGKTTIFSMDNIMWFIEDLLDQVTELYIKDPQKLYDVLEPAVRKLMDIQVSELPCTKFRGNYGFGDPKRPGNLGELILTGMVYWFNGNEDPTDDAFLEDALKGFSDRDTFDRLFNLLIDVVLHDLVEDAILAKLEIRVNKLLKDSFLNRQLGRGINVLLWGVLRGNFSYLNLVKIIFALEVLPYSSLYDVLDQLLLSKYVTPSFTQGLGQFVAYVLNDFTHDENPMFKGDSEVAYDNSKQPVEVTQKNYRSPTMVSVTMGEDSKTEATIGWFSKSTVGGDIEIYETETEPTFKGKATTGRTFSISKTTEPVIRQFPGIDLDIFGLFWYEFKMNRHTVKLSGLKPGKTYFFRVGDAHRGWWSQTGSVTTADGGKDVTFFHMTDPQSQNDRQYSEAWLPVLQAAFTQYPDAAFIANSGDLVDQGNNSKQWQGMFDVGAPYLMHTYQMPASGNHEDMGQEATVNYFVLPNVPAQDTETGVYYSFDYNNVHFAVLNTNLLDDNKALTNEQLDWLKADMQKSKAGWKFVMLHKAPYSQGSHYKDKDVCNIRDQLGALMPELGVDVVFQGHDHVYMRTASLNDNKIVPTKKVWLEKDGEVFRAQEQPAGTSYVISGTAGVKTYNTNDLSEVLEYIPAPEASFGLDAPMYTAVEIKDQVLYLTAYAVKGGESVKMDSFAIRKDPSQGKQVAGTPEAIDQERTSKFITYMQTFAEKMQKIAKVIRNLIKIYILRVKL